MTTNLCKIFPWYQTLTCSSIVRAMFLSYQIDQMSTHFQHIPEVYKRFSKTVKCKMCQRISSSLFCFYYQPRKDFRYLSKLVHLLRWGWRSFFWWTLFAVSLSFQKLHCTSNSINTSKKYLQSKSSFFFIFINHLF